jgi:hemolysin activation/secretion protein
MSPAFFSHARHNKGFKALWVSTALLSLVLAGPKLISQAYAQEVPGSADVGRIQNDRERDLPLAPPATGADLPSAAAPAQMPEGAQDIHLVLNDVIIEDSTSFSADRLQAVYAPYLNRDITLDQVYAIVSHPL